MGVTSESLCVSNFQKLIPGGNVSGMMDGSTGAVEEDDDANGCAGSVGGAELEAAVLLSAVGSTLILLAS